MIIDIMNGKKMYLVTSSVHYKMKFRFATRYTFFVKASDVRSAHQFAQQHLGPGVSFSTRESPWVEGEMVGAEIYEAP